MGGAARSVACVSCQLDRRRSWGWPGCCEQSERRPRGGSPLPRVDPEKQPCFPLPGRGIGLEQSRHGALRLSGLPENPAVPGLAPGQLDRAPNARDQQRDDPAIPMLCRRLVGSAEGPPGFVERPAATPKVAGPDEDPRAVHRGDVVSDEPLTPDGAYRPLRYEPHGLEP